MAKRRQKSQHPEQKRTMAKSGLSSGNTPNAITLRASKRPPQQEKVNKRKIANQGSARSSVGRQIGKETFYKLVGVGLGRRSPKTQPEPPVATEEKRKGPHKYAMETQDVKTEMTTRRKTGLVRKNVPFKTTKQKK